MDARSSCLTSPHLTSHHTTPPHLTSLPSRLSPPLPPSPPQAIYYMDGSYNFGCGDSQGSGNSPWLGSTEDCDGAAQYVNQKIPSSIKQVFSGEGGDICTGGRFNDGCGDGPVKQAYQIWTNYGCRWSWDPITVYLAVMGDTSLYSSTVAGTNTVDYYGNEAWDTSNTGNNQYHVYINNDNKGDVTRILDDAMCAAPYTPSDDDHVTTTAVELTNKETGKCLTIDSSSSSPADYTNVQIGTCTEAANQVNQLSPAEPCRALPTPPTPPTPPTTDRAHPTTPPAPAPCHSAAVSCGSTTAPRSRTQRQASALTPTRATATRCRSTHAPAPRTRSGV